MAAPKGQKKYGGRVKGTPNKKSLIVREILEASGVDLVSQIIETMKQLSPDEKAKTLIALMPYCYPKLAQLEVKASLEDHRKLEEATDEQLDAILAQAKPV